MVNNMHHNNAMQNAAFGAANSPDELLQKLHTQERVSQEEIAQLKLDVEEKEQSLKDVAKRHKEATQAMRELESVKTTLTQEKKALLREYDNIVKDHEALQKRFIDLEQSHVGATAKLTEQNQAIEKYQAMQSSIQQQMHDLESTYQQKIERERPRTAGSSDQVLRRSRRYARDFGSPDVVCMQRLSI